METVKGIVHRVTYQNQENGYCVIKVKPAPESARKLFDVEVDADQTITVTGSLLMIKKGDEAEFLGEWKEHHKYGSYLDVQRFHLHQPTSLDGLARFLATDYFSGIGPVTAQLLVDEFGEQLPEVIENSPQKLAKVKGVSREKSQEIQDAWTEAKTVRSEMIALQGLGITPLTAQKVINQYGAKSVDQIRQNPYQLAQDIWGVGFTKADEIAKGIGFKNDHPFRVQAGISYALLKALDDGHMYLPREELIEVAQKLLGVNKERVQEQLETLVNSNQLVVERGDISQPTYLKQSFNQEQELAQLLRTVHDTDRSRSKLRHIAGKDVEKRVKEIEKENEFELSTKQREAIMMSLSAPLSVLTGGPGTGKTTTINTLLALLLENSVDVA
ncbi:AAA family ATPase, partial [candidate division WWE3 bacterium]|nr:AAA family ATPase [candidate division WWE3 bacterium]